MDKVVDGVEPDQALDDEIDRNNNIEEPRDDQNEDAGNEGDDRRQFGSGDDHDCPRVWNAFWEGAQRVRLKIDRRSTRQPQFGSTPSPRARGEGWGEGAYPPDSDVSAQNR